MTAAVGRDVAAEDAGIDVGVHQRPRHRQAVAPGRHLAEPAADGQRRVTAVGDLAGEGGRGVTESRPQRERVRLGEDALALEGRRHRRLEPLGERDERGGGRGGAEAEVEKRVFGGVQDLGGPWDLSRG